MRATAAGGRHDRQHRHARGGVVVAELHGQRPEVRRRPEEDDREQDDRGPGSPGRSPPPSRPAPGSSRPPRRSRCWTRSGASARGCTRRRRTGSPPSASAAASQFTARPSTRVAAAPSTMPDTSASPGLIAAFGRRAGHSGRRECASSPRRCPGRGSSSACSRCRPRARRRPASPPSARTGQAAPGQQHGRQGGDQQQLDDARLGQQEQRPGHQPRRAPCPAGRCTLPGPCPGSAPWRCVTRRLRAVAAVAAGGCPRPVRRPASRQCGRWRPARRPGPGAHAVRLVSASPGSAASAAPGARPAASAGLGGAAARRGAAGRPRSPPPGRLRARRAPRWPGSATRRPGPAGAAGRTQKYRTPAMTMNSTSGTRTSGCARAACCRASTPRGSCRGTAASCATNRCHLPRQPR